MTVSLIVSHVPQLCWHPPQLLVPQELHEDVPQLELPQPETSQPAEPQSLTDPQPPQLDAQPPQADTPQLADTTQQRDLRPA